MRITFITTVRHNVGDDFVREGLVYLLKRALRGRRLRFETVHKHAPITARRGFGRLRRLQPLDDRLPLQLSGDRIAAADWVVQSGAPVYWCHPQVNAHCCDNEWFGPLIRRRAVPLGKTVLNIAGGSCQTFHSEGSDVCPRCRDYIAEFYRLCRTTTLRDAPARVMLQSAGGDAPVIPCTSLFAVEEHGIKAAKGEYAAVNFMPKGAHYTFGQAIDEQKWFEEFRRFYFELKRFTRVIFSCHDERERRWARRIDPKAEIFFAAPNSRKYLEFYSRATAGVVNRIHAAMALASLGKPALAVGGDTRAQMVRELGLPVLFVNDADAALLMESFQSLLLRQDFAAHIAEVKEKALKQYVALLAV